MDEEDIKKKIEEVEEQLKTNKITLATADCYSKLIEIHSQLWSLAYFKLYLEKDYLVK